jgi:hypothetical protein
MKKLVNSQQMKKIDAFTIDEIGIPAMVLMENAANQVVTAMEERISRRGYHPRDLRFRQQRRRRNGGSPHFVEPRLPSGCIPDW